FPLEEGFGEPWFPDPLPTRNAAIFPLKIARSLKMTPAGASTILHNINDGSTTAIDLPTNDFVSSVSALLQTSDGTLYGTISDSANAGVVYKLTQVDALNFTNPASATFTAGYAGAFTFTSAGTPLPTFSATGLPPWATLNPTTGVLSGTPPDTSGSPFTVTVTASNGSLPNATQQLTLSVQPPTTSAITSTALSKTYVLGSPYSFTFQATGFPVPTFSVSSGAIPPGMTLTANGYLSGVPSAGGLYTGTISASNGVGSAATQSFSITVQQKPLFTSAPLNATMTVGTPYSSTFQASGYPSPTISTINGLPQGITLSANGVLSGTPAAGSYGLYSGTVTASNIYAGRTTTDSQSYTITVQQAPAMSPIPPTTAALNTAYNYSFAPYKPGYPAPTYTLTSGSFPPGCTMTSSGLLSGTPSTLGNYSGVVTATNGVGSPATMNFTISVQPATAPTFTSGNPPAATLNVPYSFTFTASGAPTVFYSLASGSLPPGIALELVPSQSGILIWTGRILGTPTQTGTFTFTPRAANSVNPQATPSYTITVYANAFTSWSSRYFNSTQLADPTISGFTATPQYDGISNLLKYLFDINPAQSMSATDHAALPVAGMTTIGGTPYLTLTYRLNATESGLTLGVQTSLDLLSWTTVANPTILQAGTDANTGDPIMQVQVPATGTSKFIRLNVSSP
ncbi:putative Ig domain-containing protein, partial [Chthoniobacter flavus]